MDVNKVLNFLRSKNGFARADEVAAHLLGCTPEQVPAAALHQTIDDASKMAAAWSVTKQDGFDVIAWRGKTTVGLTDEQFPKALLSDDPRAKKRNVTPKAPKKDANGNDIIPPKIQAWIPGLMLVDSAYWSAADVEREDAVKASNLLSNAGILGEVRGVRREKTDGTGGYFVNVYLPAGTL